jgi:hypothetical protein
VSNDRDVYTFPLDVGHVQITAVPSTETSIAIHTAT